MPVSLFLCLCQEQGAWRGEQTAHTSDTQIHKTNNHPQSQAPPTDEGVGGALEQTKLEETLCVSQSFTKLRQEHHTHTQEQSGTHDTLITCPEKTESLAASASLVSTNEYDR